MSGGAGSNPCDVDSVRDWVSCADSGFGEIARDDGVQIRSGNGLEKPLLVGIVGGSGSGFDTESKPTFLKGEESTGPHLIQLTTESHAYLFPILRSTDSEALKSRLGIELKNVLDLGEVLRGKGHRGTVGAKIAVVHFFSERLQKSKKIGTSNWASPRLAERQLLYAANDAHVALELYRAWLGTQQKPL